MAEQGSKGHDDQGQHCKAGERTKTRWTPAANDGNGQHDRESFNRLDQRGQERGRYHRPDER
jgi:hypothetical protein